MKNPLFRRILVILVIAIAVSGAIVLTTLLADRSPVQSGTVTSSGQATIGGPFTLTDQDGNDVTEETFRGKKMLIYFGFSYCPDVCPTTLQTINVAFEELTETEKAKIQPIFVSVDPERDTPDVLKQYVSNFVPGLIGLTGTPEQVAEAAKHYRVLYKKVDDPTLTEYTMQHTSVVYLMDEEGRYLSAFNHETQPHDMAVTLKKFLK